MTQKFPFNHFFKLDGASQSSNPEVNPVIVDKAIKSLPKEAPVEGKISSEFTTEELKTVTEALLEHIKNLINSNKFHAYFANTFTVSMIHEESVECVVTTSFI